PLVMPDTTQLQDPPQLHGAAFSWDGEQLASAGGDGTIKIWNSRTGKVVQTLPAAHKDTVVSVAFHPDGKHLASRGADQTVNVWDLTATNQPVMTEKCNATRKFGTAYTIAFSPDGGQLATATNGLVNVWDWKSRQLLHSLLANDAH